MSALSQQPPPRRGAKAGYYPDPLGSRRARWWDGVRWTPSIGPMTPADAPRGKPVPAPTKVCRHCGAQSQTFEGTCPNCGRSYAANTGVVIASAVGVVLLILFLGGCFAAIAALDDISPREDDAVSGPEFDSVEIGMPKEAVERVLGEPASTAEIEQGRRHYLCVYYEDASDRFDEDEYYELCYLNGRLFAKRDFS